MRYIGGAIAIPLIGHARLMVGQPMSAREIGNPPGGKNRMRVHIDRANGYARLVGRELRDRDEVGPIAPLRLGQLKGNS